MEDFQMYMLTMIISKTTIHETNLKLHFEEFWQCKILYNLPL